MDVAAPTDWPAAELRGVTVRVDTGRWRETSVDAVDLTLPHGRITALVGESGCGKSMVAAALTGRLPPTANSDGQVLVQGNVVDGDSDWQRVRGSAVGLLPQDGIRAFRADEPVGAQLHEVARRHRKWTVERACAAASYPAEVADLLPHQHSGGQIQRAALAAALLPAPKVLIVDEPTGSLDVATAYRVWFVLREYADAGAAVLAITHDVPLLATIGVADTLVVMRDGRIVTRGSVADVAALADPYVHGFFRDVGQ